MLKTKECHAAQQRLCQALKEVLPLLETVLTDLAIIKGQYATCIDLEAAGKCTGLETLEGSLFQAGYNQEIDGLTKVIAGDDQNIAELTELISEYIGSEGACKYHEPYMTGDHMCYFSMSKTAFGKFKKNYKPIPFLTETLEFTDLTIDDRNKSNVKITIKSVVALYEKKLKNQSFVHHLLRETYCFHLHMNYQ